jgi:2-oxoglutarate dehydrogenase E2 component (dihydrolipoamide succinyltransferase)
MPQMGVSVSEGTIVAWRKQPGDWVEYEEPIVDISTDKIDTEVPSPAAGRLSEIVVEVGTTVDVGTVLARIATDARPGEAHASEHEPAGNGNRAAPPTSERATISPATSQAWAGPRPARMASIASRNSHGITLQKAAETTTSSSPPANSRAYGG